MRSLLLAATFVIGMASASYADAIAAAPAYGSAAQGVAVCYINAGTGGLTVSSIKIFREPDRAALPGSSNCPRRLYWHVPHRVD
jgi:hypothetical protein